ncbi:fused response regulator/phosphatase [Actinospica sp. MGRD01-02]|uniref:Fused response regulator/phosphatase n=1 Tax=Actinospica acidithermotolerans TaxID=2828514 RepID=A0A941EAP9_9ACTN|nr:fused response regulator/phosphatase [Actinospica acidithermotolerans]MBR7825594.1 fused response regulator/phosphatase [Actinospica acidithermotolerans]
MTGRAAAEAESGLVLIVDDNAANRYLLSQWLRRAGHEVVEAVDGADALDKLSRLNAVPEVALLDIVLPDMTGFELCRRLKAAPRTDEIPVIHISATAVSVADRTQGLDGGADAYLTEPVDRDELLATITAVLRYTRARRRVQRLADRLLLLNRATLDLYRATDFERFARAAVDGTRAVLGAQSASVYLSLAGRPVRTYQLHENAPVVSEPLSTEVLERIARTVLGAGSGARIAFIPQREWRTLVSGPVLRGDVLVAAVRARAERPPVCVAIAADQAPPNDDKTLLIQIAQACALALESLRNYAEEHALALELQRSFLPSRLAASEGIRLAVRYVPASTQAEIGGDFYEAIETRRGLLLAIGDVVGHSLQAAILMGEVRHALRAYAIEGHAPEVILDLLDNVLAHGRSELTTVTLCLVLVESGRRRLRIANAGHIPPLLASRAGTRFVAEHGRLLGLGGGRFEATVVDLPEPTRLVLCTDGLVEVRHVSITKNLAAYEEAVRGGPEDLEALCDAVLAEFGRGKDDDIALLAADLIPEPPRDERSPSGRSSPD